MNPVFLLAGLGVGVIVGLFVPFGFAVAIIVGCIVAAMLPQLKLYRMAFLGIIAGDIIAVLIKYYGVSLAT